MRRVVVGINSMGFVEGPMELEVPQHSAAFRKMVKTEMLLQKLGPEQLLKKLHAIRRRKAAAAAAQVAWPGGGSRRVGMMPRSAVRAVTQGRDTCPLRCECEV